MSQDNLDAGFYHNFFHFLKEKKYPLDISPYAAANLMNTVITDCIICNLNLKILFSLHNIAKREVNSTQFFNCN